MTEAEANAWLVSWFEKDAQELENRAKGLETLLPRLPYEGSRQQIKAEIDIRKQVITENKEELEHVIDRLSQIESP